MPDAPEVKYARNGEVHLAYQQFGSGDHDLVLVLGYLTHLDLMWENPRVVRWLSSLGRFARVLVFDKRGEGLSDRDTAAPTLEDNADDLRAVLDAAGVERAVLFGMSQGGPVCILFASQHPARVEGLVLYATMARTVEAPDYPWASPIEAVREATAELVGPAWGTGAALDTFAPSVADDADARRWMGRLERSAASPGVVLSMLLMALDTDVRALLPAIQAPTLVIHRTGDRAVNVRNSRWLATQIPGARLVELPGVDHQFFWSDAEPITAEIAAFVTGGTQVAEPERVLTTVMFTDIVDSTQRANALGDGRWRDVLDAHDAIIRREVARAGGLVVKSTGDGVLARFDGPARAVRCGLVIRDAVHDLGVEVRIGVHTGEVEIRGDDIAGVAVHMASRVQAIAEPDEVLVSRTLVDLVAGSGLVFEPRGEHAIRGVPGSWALFAAEAG